ncbi:hypothetical protein H310_10636 [Aphanomyces invadans]|uniref:Uncharacterized protein n=1 Tax=Aphanomyces invadans TaxID=157072 RepID=A0A024TPR3_9STRA|nr:hypothetical protein H310_10636 [Aphanomyces invadans]ETV95979.1 hypothetical protein H310_10636 [Aphanomyces invadans]|eukprot:XP_008875290.1 hypothetical protein H310_10636 [Aphanomyces invadans]
MEPANNFCEAPNSTTNFASVLAGQNIRAVSDSIEHSPHKSMHITLSGAMNNVYLSPIESTCTTPPSTPSTPSTTSAAYAATTSPKPSAARRPRPSKAARSTTTVPVHHEPSVKAFFAGFPIMHHAMTDATQVNEHSYVYQFEGLLGDVYSNCDMAGAATTRRRLQACPQRALELAADEIDREIVKIRAMYFDHYLGGTTDFPAAFKTSLHDGESPALTLVHYIRSGADPICIASWPVLNEFHFGCRGDGPSS